MRIALSVLVFVAFGLRAHAAEPRFYFDNSSWQSASARQCFERSRGPSDGMKCAQAELKLQDDRLTRAYDALRATGGQDQKQALLFEERGWISYKKGFCELWSQQDREANPGLAWDYYVLLCNAQVTSLRASELEYALGQLGGTK